MGGGCRIVTMAMYLGDVKNSLVTVKAGIVQLAGFCILYTTLVGAAIFLLVGRP